MKRGFVFILLAAAQIMGAGNVLAAPCSCNCRVDWPAFMKQHEMEFKTLPRSLREAPHFGNAMVGSMLYAADNTLKLQIFRADVQDHRDDAWGWTASSRPRLMIGYFSLETVGKVTGCNWRKDLWNAELTGTITTDKGEIKIRHLTHAVDMAIVTALTPSEGEKGFTWTWHPAKAQTTRPGYPTNQTAMAAFAKHDAPAYAATLKVWEPNPPGRLEKEDAQSVWIQDLLAGGQYATAWCEQGNDTTRTLLVTIANSYPEASAALRAKEDLKRFCTEEPQAWFQGHRAWWHAYYQRSFVTLPDKKLESLYWQTIYRYGCTSRAGRSMVDTSDLWACGGNPCIESSLSLVNNIQEMLLQSRSDPAQKEPGPLRIFPALPAAWKNVEFHDLRAEGAFLVSAKRANGKTQWILIRSLAGEPCRIKLDWENVSVGVPRRMSFQQVSPGVYEIGMNKGEEVLLKPLNRSMPAGGDSLSVSFGEEGNNR